MNKNTENIKLIVCDIDNTLIPSGSMALSKHNREALQKAIAQGSKSHDQYRQTLYLPAAIFV
jgi:Predicted hydrolases of the HAD superfamily